jgi:hypothetical protein
MSFTRDPKKDKNALLWMFFSKVPSTISILPIRGSKPMEDCIANIPLPNGTIFILSKQLIGLTTKSDHTVRYACGNNVGSKFIEQVRSMETLVPKIMNCSLVELKRRGYSDLEHWMKDPKNVYIGRKGVVFVKDQTSGDKYRFPHTDSIYSSGPIIDGKIKGTEFDDYRTELRVRIALGQINILELAQKTISSWFYPQMCHGKIIQDEFRKCLYEFAFHIVERQK